MTVLRFVAEIVRAIVWPGVTLTIVLLLRRQLAALIPLMTKLKYKHFEVFFGREAAEASAEAAQLPAGSGAAALEAPLRSDAVLRLLQVSPRAAVIEAWRELEQAATDAAGRRNIEPEVRKPVAVARRVSALAEARLIGPQQVGLFHDLRVLRNEATHLPD